LIPGQNLIQTAADPSHVFADIMIAMMWTVVFKKLPLPVPKRPKAEANTPELSEIS
jgi:hypothetical protein